MELMIRTPTTAMAAPVTPPIRPWMTDSPETCRTTVHRDQPSAFSVPSSRTRLATDDSVSSAGDEHRGQQPHDLEARPSFDERSFASLREPPTRLARSAAVVTSEFGKLASIALATPATAPVSVARTWIALIWPL